MSVKYITNEILHHGIGSRILKIINLVSYVDFLKGKGFNYEFVYTPLNYEGFGKNFQFNEFGSYHYGVVHNLRDEYLNVCDRWENFLQFSGKVITEVNHNDVIFLTHPSLSGETELEVFNHTSKIKSKLKKTFNIPENCKKDFLDIKIHIRRGDVDEVRHADRWLDDNYYLNIITTLKEKIKDNYRITIYTQRRNFNSELYKDYNIKYDDETLDNEVWLELINSDILVIGKSAFSYSAGILNDNTVIYPTNGMFHPKLNNWKTINEI